MSYTITHESNEIIIELEPDVTDEPDTTIEIVNAWAIETLKMGAPYFGMSHNQIFAEIMRGN